MSTQKATFSITADSTGYGEDDVSLKTNVYTRGAWIEHIAYDDSSASGGSAQFTLCEISEDDDGNTVEGDALFNASSASVADLMWPRTSRVMMNQEGDTITTDVGRIHTTSQVLRGKVDEARSGDVFTVVVYYDTAGDWRF